MNCARCGESGAERMEVRFQNGASLITYLCRTCAAAERRGEEVRELVTASER